MLTTPIHTTMCIVRQISRLPTSVRPLLRNNLHDFTSLSHICEMAIASVKNQFWARKQPSVLFNRYSSRIYIDISKHEWTKSRRKTNYRTLVASRRVDIMTSARRMLFWESKYWLHCSFGTKRDIDPIQGTCWETRWKETLQTKSDDGDPIRLVQLDNHYIIWPAMTSF